MFKNKFSATTIFILVCMVIIPFSSCDWAKQKAKNTINETGETVGKGTSEFFKGVTNGVDETFACTVEVTGDLSHKGLKAGKFKVTSSKDAENNILTAYLIFDKDFRENVSVKIFDPHNQEYGRTGTIIEGKKGEARYVDFVFDIRTDIESKSKVVLEQGSEMSNWQ